MAPSQDFLRRNINPPPTGTEVANLFYSLLAVGAVLRVSRYKLSNGLAVPGNGDGFAMLDRPKKFGQPCLGFSCLDFTHSHSNQLF